MNPCDTEALGAGSAPAPTARSRRRAAGFTLVEIMVGGAVATIGMYASMSLALNALKGTSERRDSMLGETLAEHLLATIQADATTWTNQDPASVPLTPVYLKQMAPFIADGTTGWLPGLADPFNADKRVGQLGSDSLFYDAGALYEVQKERGQRYCTWFRLSWVTQDLVRAEVKVAWARMGSDATKYLACPLTMVNDVGTVGSVTLPATVMKNVYVQ